jgi:AraC-like DNA-binding protein
LTDAASSTEASQTIVGADKSQPRLVKLAGRHRERAPVCALRPHVERLWIFEVPNACELEIVPDGCVALYWDGKRISIAGPDTQIALLRASAPSTFVGARFAPGVAHRWLGVSARELLNVHVPLDDVWDGHSVQEATEALAAASDPIAAASVLERILVGRLSRARPTDPIVAATIDAARAPASGKGIVRKVTAEYGWSERTLRRHCEEAFGYGPKTLDRILRFQRFISLLWSNRLPFSHLAAAAGYADQAHLAREVRRLAGQSPTGLLAELRA